MSTYAKAHSPEFRHSKPLAQISRPQLAARITVLREALDRMADQAALDGVVGFTCRGSIKVELLTLEGLLRSRDRAELLARQQETGVPDAWKGAVGQ